MLMEDNLFQKYSSEKIALYGLGTETEKALLSLKDRFEIIGLLDSFQEEGNLYGKNIFSLKQMIEKGVKLIIVVARPGSCKAIGKKIGDICRKNEIALMDIRGKDLLEKKQVIFDFTDVAGGTKEELYQKISQAEVVSFDLFDTLIMREALFSSDIIELTDIALREKGIHITNFVSMRLEAEKRLAKYGAPRLEELYKNIVDKTEGIPLSASELAMMEWEIDCKTILARQAVCDVYEFCIQQEKSVYIVTDTYYRREQIERILEKCHLGGYTELLVSCEYHTGKTQELFRRFKELAKAQKYLHVGDDLTADIKMAARAGMDTYHIFSGEELLDAVGNMGLEPYMDTLQERLKIGMFVARLFNNPFQFEPDEQRIILRDAYEIGYLICAPIITDFLFWFRDRVRYYGLQNIWFSARDGYLLQKLYRILEESLETVYFQTSRVAAIRAGMMDDSDIRYVDSMKFSGTLEENVKTRFGLKVDEIKSVRPNNGIEDGKGAHIAGLLDYKDSVLEHAADEQRRYKAYINTLDMREGAIAFFDFVAKGTTQMYVQRLVSHHLKGLYFLQLEPDLMADKGLDIEPFYSKEETEANGIYDNYYVLETILTAPHPCVCGFDDTGSPVYVEETRKESDIECIMRAQEGIQDYFCRYLELIPENINNQSKGLDEVILGFIHNLKILDEDFLSLIVEDPFFNRMTDIKVLI